MDSLYVQAMPKPLEFRMCIMWITSYPFFILKLLVLFSFEELDIHKHKLCLLVGLAYIIIYRWGAGQFMSYLSLGVI